MEPNGEEGMAGGARGDWLYCSAVRRQTMARAGIRWLLPFPLTLQSAIPVHGTVLLIFGLVFPLQLNLSQRHSKEMPKGSVH